MLGARIERLFAILPIRLLPLQVVGGQSTAAQLALVAIEFELAFALRRLILRLRALFVHHTVNCRYWRQAGLRCIYVVITDNRRVLLSFNTPTGSFVHNPDRLHYGHR